MKAAYLSVPIGLLLAAAGITLMAAAKRAPVATNEWKLTPAPRHPVTPEMWKKADGATGLKAPTFDGVDVDGKPVSIDKLTKSGPVFLYFVLQDCPCSIEAQPHYERLEQRYRGKVSFVAVTNAEAAAAKSWKSDFSVPYTVVSSPDLKLMDLYGVERSVYGMLIGKDGKILRLWPGYSGPMLAELNKEMAGAIGAKPQLFDTSTAPTLITSGCEFRKK